MKRITLDENWTFRRGFLDNPGMLKSDPGVSVNLPHDGMIGTPVTADAPAQMDMGYFTGGLSNYTKFVYIPEEWKNDYIALHFDGAMLNAAVDVNGAKAGKQHYGYVPFSLDITNLVTFGKENRITVNINASMQPNSRWYTGSGLYRGVELVHGPKLHIAQDGIYMYTKEVADGYAFLEAQIDVVNDYSEKRLAEVEIVLTPEKADKENAKPVIAKRTICAEPLSATTARMAFAVEDPVLWDVDSPELYKVNVKVTDKGVYRTHFIPYAPEECTVDEADTIFGIRTITADAVRGLRINGKSVKLKGGCLHHDNGLIGSVSLYESEARKVQKLKTVGFNAIRTAHNRPSAALIEACDRYGMYVFDEAFDAWGIGKRAGDYSQFFDECWEKDLTSFIRRDRTHPCVIMWSTGNEIPERGGLNDGYKKATMLAEAIRKLDGTRPISNGICSLWSGLDDEICEGLSHLQNAKNDGFKDLWENVTEPFTNGLDIVGYNYMEDQYEHDHELFPERVILGSENFPQEIGFRWPLVEKYPYIIGDFTWTAWDYLGEAGIGKTKYFEPDDPFLKDNTCWALMPQYSSPCPWRTANDADFDITGHMRPQGAYRSVVWGSKNTYLYSVHPKYFGKYEMISPWGFTDVLSCWSYDDYVGKPIELVVFSNADEVEILINGESAGRKKVSNERPLPCSVRFETVYQPGKVEAVSYTDGKEVSRTELKSVFKPISIRLEPDKLNMKADGHDVAYVDVEIIDDNGNVVPYAEIPLEIIVSGCGTLAGFGSANPITDEDYTDNKTVSYNGRALAIIRSGYEKGNITLRVFGEGFDKDEYSVITLKVE